MATRWLALAPLPVARPARPERLAYDNAPARYDNGGRLLVALADARLAAQVVNARPVVGPAPLPPNDVTEAIAAAVARETR